MEMASIKRAYANGTLIVNTDYKGEETKIECYSHKLEKILGGGVNE